MRQPLGAGSAAKLLLVLTVSGLLLASCAGVPSSRVPPGNTRPSPTQRACTNQTVLATWSVDQLAEQVVAVPVKETDVGAVQAEVAQGVGGLLLFGTAGPSDLGEQLTSLEAGARGGIRPFVMTDEEGGGVQRMPNLVGSLPWARQMGSTLSAGQIKVAAESMGRAMLEQGVTMDLAPVLDVDGGVGPNATDPDGARSFSADPGLAGSDGLAFAEGLVAVGVIPVVKHFPGLGGASGNTDDGPATTQPYAELESGGLLPFESAVAAGLPAVMVSNASVPGVTSLPASLSPIVIQGMLEGQLHFQGLILTDSLSAGAIAARGLSVAQATVEAVAAGADMVTFGTGSPALVTTAVDAAMTEAVDDHQVSMARLTNAVSEILIAKRVNLCTSDVRPSSRASGLSRSSVLGQR
ncbi:MAG: glycoside hydrolase family 3 N-terminal domain-containing protein [Candidatus Dormiibacterota bacterium]